TFGLTGALVVPHVINIGLETLTHRKFGASVNYGNVSRNIGGVDLAMRHTDIRFRYHPFGGSFFAGVAVGQHTLIGQKGRDIAVTYNSVKSTVPTKVKVTAKANYVAPHIGWFAIWEPGFTIGLDIGWLVPSGAKSTTEATFTNLPAGAEDTIRSTPEFAKATSDVDDAAMSGAKKSLPFLSMIRIGWMF
ncbi:MAG: hypothetical protein NTV34_22130, partial [Proteobacteria bacterium]|nr:hypothetical protein [Pseudomonadota bacterium]